VKTVTADKNLEPFQINEFVCFFTYNEFQKLFKNLIIIKFKKFQLVQLN
jgi:hypothetical protein